MDLLYKICILILVSSENVFSRAIEDNTGRFQSGELEHEESKLETKLGEDNPHSALDGTASEGDANTSANKGSAAELSEEHKSYEATDVAQSGNATGSSKKLVIYQWRNGIVPYYVDAHSYDVVIYRRIRKVLDAIQSASCLVFKPIPKPTSGHSFVHFTNPNKERECVHRLSTGQRGEPIVVLGYDCMKERDIIHSVMHLLGFRDEVTHPHRDSYIRIMWDNIQPKYRPLFTIDTKPSWTHKLAEYDTLSVMHFHDRAFSINGGPTILPLLPDRIINPLDKLSLLDKMKLHIVFENECKRRKVNFLVETCKNYAQDDKKTKDNPTEDLCAFDKFKVTTVKYAQSGKDNNKRLSAVIGVQIEQIHNGENSINNINGINSINEFTDNLESDIVGVQIDEIHNIASGINDINGIKSDIIGTQTAGVHNNDTDTYYINNINGINRGSTGAQTVQTHNNGIYNVGDDLNNFDGTNDIKNNQESKDSRVQSKETDGDSSDENNGYERTTTRSVAKSEETDGDSSDENNGYERTTTRRRTTTRSVARSEETDGDSSDENNGYKRTTTRRRTTTRSVARSEETDEDSSDENNGYRRATTRRKTTTRSVARSEETDEDSSDENNGYKRTTTTRRTTTTKRRTSTGRTTTNKRRTTTVKRRNTTGRTRTTKRRITTSPTIIKKPNPDKRRPKTRPENNHS